MNKKCFLALTIMFFNLGAAHKRETVKISGLEFEVITTPRKNSMSSTKSPLMIIAPAKKYTMTGEIFEKLATEASNLGYYVVRFNWSFVTQKKLASEGLKEESKDLRRVIKHFSKPSFVDKTKIVLVAKSFGSRVAMKGAYKDVSSLLIMTPNCDTKNTFEKNYNPIFKKKFKPVHIIISKDDPYCDVNQIYKALTKLDKSNVTVHTLAGDHNFKLKAAPSELNESVAIKSSLNWLNLQL